MVDHDALGLEGLHELVVFVNGSVGPEDVVEQQRLDVVRGQAGQLESGAVHDCLAELAHFGMDAE